MPLARTSGVGSGETALSHLFGSGEPFDAATVARLYPGGEPEYLERFTTALDSGHPMGLPTRGRPRGDLGLAAAAYPR